MILARSPHFGNYKDGSLSYVVLSIAIYQGTYVAFPSTFNYVLRKNVVGSPLSVTFELSELLRDFMQNTYDTKQPSTDAYWYHFKAEHYDSSDVLIKTVYRDGYVLNGYSYFKEGANYDPDDVSITRTAISNRVIYTLDDNAPWIPIFSGTTIRFFKDGEEIAKYDYPVSTESDGLILYVTENGVNTSINISNYLARVERDLGIVENSICLTRFFDNFSTFEADEVRTYDYLGDEPAIDTIKLKRFNECKYTPYKVVFTNKFGVEQDIYMTKKSMENINVNDEVFKFNSPDNNGIYDIYTAQYTRYSVNARETLTLNTPFLPEDYNEVVKQLMLTETAWLVNIDTNEVTPIIPKTKSLTYKTSVNDRLTQYTIDFDYAYDTINSVR